jgi:hypothetical protein
MPIETMATGRSLARLSGCGHNSHMAANNASSISTNTACFRTRSASVERNNRSTMIDSPFVTDGDEDLKPGVRNALPSLGPFSATGRCCLTVSILKKDMIYS